MGCLWVEPSFSPNPSHSCLSICLTMGHYFLRRSNPFLYTFNCSLHLRLIYSLMKGLLSSRDIPDTVQREDSMGLVEMNKNLCIMLKY